MSTNYFACLRPMAKGNLVVILLITAYFGCTGQVLAADSPTSPGRSLYVEPPEDHSGKSLDADVLSSLHDELETDLKKSQKISARSEAEVLVHVEITDFHMRSGASRWMLGAMSGKDFITSKISLVRAASGETLSSFEVTTKTANQYRGEDSIAKLHADQIAKALPKT